MSYSNIYNSTFYIFHISFRFLPDPTIRTTVWWAFVAVWMFMFVQFTTNQASLQRYYALSNLKKAKLYHLYLTNVTQLLWGFWPKRRKLARVLTAPFLFENLTQILAILSFSTMSKNAKC